jgi:hypothetical protein
MVLTRIGPLSAAKISGLLYAIMGLIVGLLFTFASLIGAALGTMGDAPDALFPLFFGVGAVVFLPIFYGFIGFLSALIGAALYNLMASMVGGVELEFEQPAAAPPVDPVQTVS